MRDRIICGNCHGDCKICSKSMQCEFFCSFHEKYHKCVECSEMISLEIYPYPIFPVWNRLCLDCQDFYGIKVIGVLQDKNIEEDDTPLSIDISNELRELRELEALED